MVTKRTWLKILRRELFNTNRPAEKDQETTQDHESPEVLNSGFTEAEFEAELERREDVLQTLENKVVRHGEKYEQFLEKAIEKKGDRRVRYLLKAKQQQIKHDVKSEIYDRLMRQQLFLVKLLLEHKKTQLKDTAGTFDFEIDIAELPADDIVEDIEEGSDQARAEADIIEEIEVALNADDSDALGVDLSDIREEAAELEAADIAEDSLAVDSALDSDVDDELEEELAKELEGLDNVLDGPETDGAGGDDTDAQADD